MDDGRTACNNLSISSNHIKNCRIHGVRSLQVGTRGPYAYRFSRRLGPRAGCAWSSVTCTSWAATCTCAWVWRHKLRRNRCSRSTSTAYAWARRAWRCWSRRTAVDCQCRYPTSRPTPWSRWRRRGRRRRRLRLWRRLRWSAGDDVRAKKILKKTNPFRLLV